MEKGKKLFVRVDSRIPRSSPTAADFEDHGRFVANVASGRYLIGGKFCNEDGGMLIFKASDIDEAKRISDADPLIERKLYEYKLYEWELLVVPEEGKL